MPNLLRAKRAAAGRVHTQHQCLHIIVALEFANAVHQLFAVDAFAWCAAVDFTASIHYCYYAVFIFASVVVGGKHLWRHEVQVVGLLYVGEFAKTVLKFGTIDFRVHQMALNQSVGWLHQQYAIHVLVERATVNLSGVCHFVFNHAPDVAQIQLLLFAVFGAHGVEHVRLHSALVGAHTNHLHFHAYVVEHFLEIGRTRSHAVHIHRAHRVDENAVGCRSHIVVALVEAHVAVGIYPFFTFLEIDDGFSDGTQCGRSGLHAIAVEHHTVDVVVEHRHTERTFNVLQTGAFFRSLKYRYQFVDATHFLAALFHSTTQVDFENGMAFHRGGAATHRQRNRHTEHQHAKHSHHDSNKGAHKRAAYNQEKFLQHSVKI